MLFLFMRLFEVNNSRIQMENLVEEEEERAYRKPNDSRLNRTNSEKKVEFIIGGSVTPKAITRIRPKSALKRFNFDTNR